MKDIDRFIITCETIVDAAKKALETAETSMDAFEAVVKKETQE